MKYQEFINDIISKRGNHGIVDEYFEKHHIIPKCVGGTDDDLNIIDLYPAEHYIAHKLLALENPDNSSLIYAWNMMSRIDDKYITEDEYEQLKINFSNTVSKNNSKRLNKSHWYTDGINEVYNEICPDGYHEGRSDKSKSKISNTLTGTILPREVKDKISEMSKLNRWYNNGEIEVFVKEKPDGFVEGRVYRVSDSTKNKIGCTLRAGNYHWYNNGVNNIKISGDIAPEGYVRGRLMPSKSGD